MAKYGLVGVVMTVLIGIILVGSVLAPTIDDVKKTAGDEVTYTNIGSDLYITDDVSSTHTFVLTAPNTYATIDGADVDLSDFTRGFYFITENLSVMFSGSVIAVCWGESNKQYNVNWGNSFDITFENGTATLLYTSGSGTTTYTYDYSWIGYRVETGGNYVNVISSSNAYHNETMNDVVVMGYYSSGDNDVHYCLKDGILTISDPDTYTSSYTSPNATLVDGTTDLYLGTLQIAVGDETFTPYVWAVAKEIDGHESSGSAYALYGVFVVIALVAIVLVGVRGFLGNRD